MILLEGYEPTTRESETIEVLIIELFAPNTTLRPVLEAPISEEFE